MKQKQQIALLVALAAIALLIWSFDWSKRPASVAMSSFLREYEPLRKDDLTVDLGAIERARKTEYKGSGRNPFKFHANPPGLDPSKPRTPSLPVGPITSTNLSPPTTALVPANLKYFGYGAVPSGTLRRAFFTDGDDVYVVSEGDVLLGRYRILKVGNVSLEFREISTGLPGAMPLDEQAAPTPSA